MKVSLIFLCLVIAMTGSFSECTPQSYCGRALIETLNMFCYNVDFEPIKDEEPKKGEETVAVEKKGSPVPLKYDNPNYLRLTGVVQECCLQPCTINTLLTYC